MKVVIETKRMPADTLPENMPGYGPPIHVNESVGIKRTINPLVLISKTVGHF